MNERIKELVEKSFIYDKQNDSSFFNKEKFAELIVRECIGVVEGGSFIHDQAPTALFAKECSGAIKRYFGVEE